MNGVDRYKRPQKICCRKRKCDVLEEYLACCEYAVAHAAKTRGKKIVAEASPSFAELQENPVSILWRKRPVARAWQREILSAHVRKVSQVFLSAETDAGQVNEGWATFYRHHPEPSV